MKPLTRASRAAFGAAMGFVLIVLLALMRTDKPVSLSHRPGEAPDDFKSHQRNDDIPSGPKRTQYTKGNYGQFRTEILHALPKSNPKGIIMCFHGCTHSGVDWFTHPEEGIVIRKSLQSGFAVIAVTSYDRRSGCWNPVDLQHVPDAFDEFVQKNNWAKNLPIFTMGGSSGGSFVTILQSTSIKARGIYVLIGRPISDDMDMWMNDVTLKTVHLLYMTRDAQLKQMFDYFLENLQGVGKKLSVTRTLEAKPCIVTEGRLVDRIYDMTPALAKEVMTELQKRLILTDKGEPTESNLYTIVTKLPSKEMFASIQEEIKACYAQHEFTAEYFDVVLQDWNSVL